MAKMTGADLRRLRVKLGLTGPALAKQLDVSRNSLAKYEKADLVAIPGVIELALAGLGYVTRRPLIQADQPTTVAQHQPQRADSAISDIDLNENKTRGLSILNKVNGVETVRGQINAKGVKR
jgi:transcriptional regulator with XRE-family HTH domain